MFNAKEFEERSLRSLNSYAASIDLIISIPIMSAELVRAARVARSFALADRERVVISELRKRAEKYAPPAKSAILGFCDLKEGDLQSRGPHAQAVDSF